MIGTIKTEIPMRMRFDLLSTALAACFAAHTVALAMNFTFEASDLDNGNVRITLTGQGFADGPSHIWHGDGLPDRADYFVQASDDLCCTLSILYAAKDPRPIDILIDGKKVLAGCGSTTGGWNTKTAKWDIQGKLNLTNGIHTLSLLRDGPFPHICALRLESAPTTSKETSISRPSAEQRAALKRHQAQQARVRRIRQTLESFQPDAVRRAIDDLANTFSDRYDAAAYRKALVACGLRRQALLDALAAGTEPDEAAVGNLTADVRTILLANPLLDFDRLLLVRRRLPKGNARTATGTALGWVPNNFNNHSSLRLAGYDNEVAVLSNLRGTPKFETLYRPQDQTLLRDVRLDFSGDRLLFSGADTNRHWAVFQIQSDGGGLEQLSPADDPDLDFFDACYLPDRNLIVCSTASYAGVPCLNGHDKVSSLYHLNPATKALRQLTFDQDHDNDPVVLDDGRVLYQRWEYSDIPHYFSRRRMTMNPDGTGQLALYGSNSWFPTAFRFAQPIPGHKSLLVGELGEHHSLDLYGDCGRLALLDTALATAYPFRYYPTSKMWGTEGEPFSVTPEILPAEKTGFVQLIPGYGKPVPGTVCDSAVKNVWLKEDPSLASHPRPLSDKYFLAAVKPTPQSLWGLYLVDVFDNMTLIAEEEGAALFEPQPFRPRHRPPVIPNRIDPKKTTADVHIADIYTGPGLQAVPRGTVKSLRIFAYHFCYRDKGGFDYIGTQSGWDVKRVLGTAEVEADGSACFQIPANTPVSIQPLDAEGRAVQLMRSWLVGMPGERVSCAGCHEQRMASLPPQRSIAETRHPQPLKPWCGAPRPFAFEHEVFPVLQRNCIGCHGQPATVGPRCKPCFKSPKTAYDTLHPYVRRAGVEGDMALLNPMEYHASTSRLIQMLAKGHHGVTLASMGNDACGRLYCWIDLNVPYAGSWSPAVLNGTDQRQRRCELAKRFAGIDVSPEDEYENAREAFRKRTPVAFVPPPATAPLIPAGLHAESFPFSADAARQLQASCGNTGPRTLDLGNGVALVFASIPTGEFVMGSQEGAPDECPRAVVRIRKPFGMSVTEITNRQYAQFDPDHDTRYVDMHYMDHVVPGQIANHPEQPVARVSWTEAMAFCEWLSRKTGLRVTLPTEAQWEWAARAGTETSFFYGTMQTDFGRFANLADSDLINYRMKWEGPSVLQRRYPYSPETNFPLHDPRFKDNWFVVDYVGQTQPNAWGLKDMIGNVSEWTRSDYRPYPYTDDDGRNNNGAAEHKVARGGSWADRPADAGSSVRRTYAPWQRVFDVGFRVVIDE